MTAYLEAVALARELRDTSEQEFRASLVRAREAGHTYGEIALVAGLTRPGVHFLVRREGERYETAER